MRPAISPAACPAKKDAANLTIKDSNGKTRLFVGLLKGGPRILFADKDGRVVASYAETDGSFGDSQVTARLTATRFSPIVVVMLTLAATLCSAALLAAPAKPMPQIPEIKFQKFTLPNGLDVILHEDHSTPIVGVNVWYHVGSKDERPGRTGFAHLFEHMMFQGSKHFDKVYFGPIQSVGGRLNGSTAMDRTNYWETVPSNYLELALWMESDRMGFLLPAMTQAKLDNQRDVVKNERRQSYENRPYGLVHETILAALYPPDHPYSWPTIGSMQDITAASREDIADFFRRYYHPGNASLCIAGDFDPAEAKRLVEKYFGPIPAGPKVVHPKPSTPELTEEKRIHMTDHVGLARVYIVWPTPRHFTPEDAALDILGHVLGGGRTSRMFRSLGPRKADRPGRAGLSGRPGVDQRILHRGHGPQGPYDRRG